MCFDFFYEIPLSSSRSSSSSSSRSRSRSCSRSRSRSPCFYILVFLGTWNYKLRCCTGVYY